MKKNILILIVILLIIAIIISILIFAITNYEPRDEYYQLGSGAEEYEIKMEGYYKVKTSIEQYFNSLNKETYYRRDDDGGYLLAPDEDINLNIISYLSKEYINKNNITTKNLNNYIKLLDGSQTIEIIDMKTKLGENADKYLVRGIAVNSDYELTEEFYLYVILDNKNETFAIEPINNISDISKIEIINEDQNIEKNGINTYTDYSPSLSDILNNYITRYKTLALAVPDIAYNYLDEQYREKRFGNVENFKQYVQENRNTIKQTRAVAYLSEYLYNKEFVIEYKIYDQFGRIYVFDEKDELNYKIKLDTYTIMSDEDYNYYINATNLEKVEANIDDFFQMINARDYTAAYSVLSDGFKSTYFKTESSFESFMKQTLYDNCQIDFGNFSDKISGVFTQYVEIKNGNNNNDKKIRMNIVMQLEGETGYKLSFEIL